MASIPTREMKLTEARAHFSEVVNDVFRHRTRVSVTKGGIPVGAIVSIEDLDRLNRLDQQRQEDFDVFSRASDAFADEPWPTVQNRIDDAVASVRTTMRAEREATIYGDERRMVAETTGEDYQENNESAARVNDDAKPTRGRA